MAKLILFGLEEHSVAARAYFDHDSPHEVVAFTVEAGRLNLRTFGGLPVVAFEEIEARYPPGEFQVSVPHGPDRLNAVRRVRFEAAKLKGYELASYVSSKALVWPDLTIGENCHIVGQPHIAPVARIGDNVMIGSRAIVGHHVLVEDHCFVGAGAVILGNVTVGESSVLESGAVIQDGVDVARHCWIGAGAFVARSTEPGRVYLAAESDPLPPVPEEVAATALGFRPKHDAILSAPLPSTGPGYPRSRRTSAIRETPPHLDAERAASAAADEDGSTGAA